MRIVPERLACLRFVLPILGALLLAVPVFSEDDEDERPTAPLSVDIDGTISGTEPVSAAWSAVVNFEELARREAKGLVVAGPDRTWMPRELPPPAEPYFPPAPESRSFEIPMPMAPSPSPSTSFMGLDDVAMVDSLYIVIPPDIAGAVGPTRIMESFNNNYRIRDKATGTTLNTVGTATFWAPVVAANERLSLTDPRTLYDPYNNRWIVEMQTVTTGAGKILVGVSQTSDPAGLWNLYSFNTAVTIDFPIVGFNKNWISVSINRYSNAGVFQRGINLVVDYPQARAGVGTGTLITHVANTHFCSAPCVTYSAASDTLYVVTHLSSAGATYQLDTVTGTSAAPVYTSGGTLVRTGGGWVQPSGNLQPQSAPNAGASACGATPCPIETQDSQIRSAPAYRGGFIYYAQTVGLPSGGLTHTGAQWTKIAAPGGAFSDGGRIEDPTATSTNGGKWYDNTHIAVNSLGDFIVGYTQLSSAQHPSAGYSIHLGTDGAGTIRDPLIYHAGEDYYHKTFSTATGRNRWGDFSTAQVDPSDDQTLWTLQEYAKTRPGTDDGNTGANSSRWSSWWAGVTTVTNYTITASAGPNGSISPSGAVVVASGANQAFTITPAACYHVADVLVDGVSVGAVGNYTFTNVMANHTISASFAINTYTITASAGAGGTISPSGATVVNCGANQIFNITPGACSVIADVIVDGVSQGAIAGYTFTNVMAGHTISATFSTPSYTINASAAAGGSISPSGAVVVSCGASQLFNITPASCFTIADVTVDGVSQGAIASYTFTNVMTTHTIAAAFAPVGPYTITATAGAGGTISPSGAVGVPCGANQAFNMTPNAGFAILDVKVDGSSVGTPASHTFTNVQANHTIDATFSDTNPPSCLVIFPNGGDTLIVGNIATLSWAASDGDSVTCVDLFLSRTGGSPPFDTLAVCQPDTGTFAWTVTGPPTNMARFRIVATDRSGNTCDDESDADFVINDVTSGVNGRPVTDFSVAVITANPSRGPARILLSVPSPGHVRIAVYDVIGRELAILADRDYEAGRHEIAWDGRGPAGSVPAGLYFIRATGPGEDQVRRLMVTH